MHKQAWNAQKDLIYGRLDFQKYIFYNLKHEGETLLWDKIYNIYSDCPHGEETTI